MNLVFICRLPAADRVPCLPPPRSLLNVSTDSSLSLIDSLQHDARCGPCRPVVRRTSCPRSSVKRTKGSTSPPKTATPAECAAMPETPTAASAAAVIAAAATALAFESAAAAAEQEEAREARVLQKALRELGRVEADAAGELASFYQHVRRSMRCAEQASAEAGTGRAPHRRRVAAQGSQGGGAVSGIWEDRLRAQLARSRAARARPGHRIRGRESQLPRALLCPAAPAPRPSAPAATKRLESAGAVDGGSWGQRDWWEAARVERQGGSGRHRAASALGRGTFPPGFRPLRFPPCL